MLHERLKEERLRLGLTQPVFAAEAEASKRTQIAWENGESAPDAKQLEKLAAIGVDVLYVVTGRPTDGNAHQRVELDQLIKQLSSKERELLEYYRAADDVGKKALLQTAKALSREK